VDRIRVAFENKDADALLAVFGALDAEDAGAVPVPTFGRAMVRLG
jgi:hypothetical protein